MPISGKSLAPWTAMSNRSPPNRPSTRCKPLLFRSLRYEQLKQANARDPRGSIPVSAQRTGLPREATMSLRGRMEWWPHCQRALGLANTTLKAEWQEQTWESDSLSWSPAFLPTSCHDVLRPECHGHSSFPLTILLLDQRRAASPPPQTLPHCFAQGTRKPLVRQTRGQLQCWW